ncbi:Regulatory protein AfsR [Nonomuraea coxensis DSM 45129]|uniref:Regulatory protein AfsR n=1 Tax=Nonomuraea coxensis DSM 45129 TaxID=1122611 RepID=A0ABX8UFL6_9ACTN|nr:BTAD domain-containing putative transcriptional regulator [Nonomuraea coxensis]QYC45541.1 Regulatory protein AfsR [Nonomuraea coxensis DSM 45129]
MAVEFRLLGSIEAHVDGRPVDVGPARQRSLLAALLVEPDQPVSADQLVERVWGDRAPHQAKGTLRTYLSRLRAALAGEAEIARRAGGYVLTLDPENVDLHRFHRLVARARSAPEGPAAIDLLDRALALWRGEPFAELDTPWIRAVRAEVENERIGAELDRTDLLLRHGRHHELLATLATQTADRPLDERLAGQLMLALYRNGRQADALDRYQSLRTRLAEELGADPSPPLRRLHQQILTADPALAAPAAEPRAAPAPVPRQLPAPPKLFTGRAEELRALTAAQHDPGEPGDTMGICAIVGTGGIGKTWLALHWAHQQAGRFPDGQLYVNLRGFAPGTQPVSPAVAVRGFLDALGVAPAAIPADPDAQAALYRSLVAGKRLLVVLDNAAASSQVISLLPGDPTCTVLVTSRNKLTTLVAGHGARLVLLDVLGGDEARDLLARHLGADRLATEPEAVEGLLRVCGNLPLALGIVAARVAAHPGLPLSVLAEELADHSAWLDALDTGEADLSVRAVFSWSYDALDTGAAALLGLLGLAPGPDISLAAAASLAALPLGRAGAILRRLDAAHLIQQHVPGRYRMHDLIRAFAAERARDDVAEDARAAALRRLVDFYLHTAKAGDRLLQQHRERIDFDEPAAGCRPEPLPDLAAALSWFEAEHACLLAAHRLAADQGWHSSVWRLAWALRTFHRRGGRWHEDLALWQVGLAAAERLGEVAARLQAHRYLGINLSELGRNDEARHHLELALTLAERSADAMAEAHVLIGLGWAEKARGDDRRAVDHLTRAAGLYRALGNPVWEADALATIGWFHAQSGRHDEAVTQCETALGIYRKHDDPEGEADMLNSLGYVAHAGGRHADALTHYEQARVLFQSLGHSYSEADTLDRIGQAQAALGRPDQARRTWRQALGLYLAQQRGADAERVQGRLAALTE